MLRRLTSRRAPLCRFGAHRNLCSNIVIIAATALRLWVKKRDKRRVGSPWLPALIAN
jgi:hypothetical protein